MTPQQANHQTLVNCMEWLRSKRSEAASAMIAASNAAPVQYAAFAAARERRNDLDRQISTLRHSWAWDLNISVYA